MDPARRGDKVGRVHLLVVVVAARVGSRAGRATRAIVACDGSVGRSSWHSDTSEDADSDVFHRDHRHDAASPPGEQGRSPQRPRPSRGPQPQGRDTRPHLRAPTPPGFRPQPRHRRHRPVEHRLPRMSHHGPPGPGLEQHLSPLGWEHINLTGDYTWRPNTRGPGRYRPLRKPPRRP